MQRSQATHFEPSQALGEREEVDEGVEWRWEGKGRARRSGKSHILTKFGSAPPPTGAAVTPTLEGD